MADGATRGPASQAVADSRRLAQTAEEAGERARAEEQRSSGHRRGPQKKSCRRWHGGICGRPCE